MKAVDVGLGDFFVWNGHVYVRVCDPLNTNKVAAIQTTFTEPNLWLKLVSEVEAVVSAEERNEA